MTPGTAGALIGQTLGGYRLTGLLGAGGMAEVYRAEDLKLGREVAVKILPASLAADAGYVERFRNEARQVAALNHPNVVPVYHYDEERGLLFLVMPVLKESLRDRMEREGVLLPSEAGRIVVQIAAALDAAHALGLVHRDVKPENILINSEGKALLTDFGIARELSFLRESGTARTLAATGLPVGTPEYMAPEQLRAAGVDQRADIYALGAVLYELLTGSVPHEAATPYEVAALVLTAPLRPPSQRNPAIWPQLDHVVTTALAQDPNERYQDTRSFALALRKAVLERDTSVQRYTMPMGAFDGSTLAALRSLQPSAAAQATTASAGQSVLTAPVEQAEPLAQASQPLPVTDWPVPAGHTTWRQRLRQTPGGGRKTLLLASVIALALIAVCGGSSLALLNNLSAPIVGNGIQSPFGGATSTAPGQTPGSTVTTGGVTTVLNSATATAGAGATATSSAQGTPGATPTNTAAPATPTASPVPPPNLTFSPQTLTLTQVSSKTCRGSQTITNHSAQPITWQWKTISPGPNGGLEYWLPGFSKPMGGMPNQKNLGAGESVTLIVFMNCGPQTSFTVTVTDNLNDQFTVFMDTSG